MGGGVQEEGGSGPWEKVGMSFSGMFFRASLRSPRSAALRRVSIMDFPRQVGGCSDTEVESDARPI